MIFGAIVNGMDSLISLSWVSLFVYTNATDFWGLFLYPATLLNCSITSNSLGWILLSFPYSVSCHLRREFDFFASLNTFYFFLLSVWLLMLGLLVLCWTVVVRVGILVLFLILREDCICCGLLIDGCYEIEVCFLYPYTLKSFNQEKMLYFVKCFFCINWEDHMVLASSVINVLYHTDSFASVEPHLHCRNKSHLVMMDNPFNILFDSIG